MSNLSERVKGRSSTILETEEFRFESEGDSIEGKLVEIVSLTNKRTGDPFKKYVVKTASGHSHFMVNPTGPTQLLEGLEGLASGDEIKATYLGEVKTKNGRTMKRFSVLGPARS
jgi:hypothetical protein